MQATTVKDAHNFGAYFHNFSAIFTVNFEQFFYHFQRIFSVFFNTIFWGLIQRKLQMWANAEHDGRPAEHRWRPLFNAAKFG